MSDPTHETSASDTARILIVDDDPGTYRMMRSWYNRGPYELLEAKSGEEGFEIAVRENPDVILLDLRMPGAGGIATARRLKSDPATRAIPVLVLTACRSTDDKVEAFSAGADDYVTKPFEFEEVDARIQVMLRRRGQLVRLESTVENLKTDNRELEQLLIVDEKTGLFNFRHFQGKLCDEWERAERYGAPLSLLFFDIDNFKQVNDTWGHPAGDLVLQEFATLVAGGARTTDTAARYGGEEFAILLPHTDGTMAGHVAERIRTAVEEFAFLASAAAAGAPIRITVSGGLATFPSTPGIDSVDDLIEAADRALYRAKSRGKNRVEIETGDGGPDGSSPAGGGGSADDRARRARFTRRTIRTPTPEP